MAAYLQGETRGEGIAERVGKLGNMLDEGEAAAYRDMENNLLSETEYYLRYMVLRKTQLAVLARISDYLRRREAFPGQAKWLSGLMRSVSRSFHEYNNALGLLEELAGVKGELEREALPATREEFEARAIDRSGAEGHSGPAGAERHILRGLLQFRGGGGLSGGPLHGG